MGFYVRCIEGVATRRVEAVIRGSTEIDSGSSGSLINPGRPVQQCSSRWVPNLRRRVGVELVRRNGNDWARPQQRRGHSRISCNEQMASCEDHQTNSIPLAVGTAYILCLPFGEAHAIGLIRSRYHSIQMLHWWRHPKATHLSCSFSVRQRRSVDRARLRTIVETP